MQRAGAALSWLQHNHARLKYATDVLKCIRFPLIPLWDLQRYMQEMPLTRLDSGCQRYLQEALDYHCQLYAQPVLQSLRSGSAVLLVARGSTADNCAHREMWAAEPGTRWGTSVCQCTTTVLSSMTSCLSLGDSAHLIPQESSPQTR